MNLTIHTDGGARGNPGPAAIGIVAHQGDKVTHEHHAFIGTKTNNVAEYEALQYAAEWLSRFCSEQQVDSVTFYLDSLLVVSQIRGEWKIKQSHLLTYHHHILRLLNALPCSWQIEYVPRAKNTEADALVNQALDARQS